MSEGILSQAEIDALLKGGDDAEQVDGFSEAEDVPELNAEEKDALGEIANISMGSAATALSALLIKKVDITTPTVTTANQRTLQQDYPRPYVIIEVKYKEGLQGGNLLVISEKDAAIIADLMMGGTGEAPVDKLGELHISAVCEAMNQMMGSAATSMSTIFNKRIDIMPPSADMVDFDRELLSERSEIVDDNFIKIAFRIVIDGLVDSELMQLLPFSFAQSLIKELFASMGGGMASPPPEPVVESRPSPPKEETRAEQVIQQEKPTYVAEQREAPRVQVPPQEQVHVQPVNFAQLGGNSIEAPPQNLDLILDVPLSISVELGRTIKSIRDILDFSAGSIVELDKLAGEPVDMLVNGKLFARGEVVVIDENFGVRIKDIVSPMERIKNLQ